MIRSYHTLAERHDPWDAVVIGAGPAGAIAARQLALQGLQVLLIDKARLPRDKVCGGCLGGAALATLRSVGLGHIPAKLGGVPLRTFELASEGAVAAMPIGRRMAVSRAALDGALVREARRAGATVCDQTQGLLSADVDSQSRSVLLRSHGGEARVRAKVVLIATGLSPSHPPFVTRVPSRSRIGLGALVDAAQCPIPPGALRMACSASGYVGVTAVEGGHVDVAAAVDSRDLAAARSPAALINHILNEAGFPCVDEAEDVPWRGTPALTRRAKPLGTYRCLLIGDAAGYVEPFTGEGIGWAMQSAVLATSLVSDRLDAWDAETPARWDRVYQQTLARHQRSCRLISQLLRSRPLRQLAIWSLRHAPALSRPVVRRLDQPLEPQLSFQSSMSGMIL
jgi:flavin-dependent dehydrogenase